MKRSIPLVGILTLLLGACGGDDTAAAPAAEAPAAPASAPTTAPTPAPEVAPPAAAAPAAAAAADGEGTALLGVHVTIPAGATIENATDVAAEIVSGDVRAMLYMFDTPSAAGGPSAVTLVPTMIGATPEFDRNDVRPDGGWAIAYHFASPNGSSYVASTIDLAGVRWLKCDVVTTSAESYAAGRALCEGLHPRP
jgi:hypothetical protein